MAYKPYHVTWCCSSMIVVNLGFACVYFASSLAVVVVRQSRFAPWLGLTRAGTTIYPIVLTIRRGRLILLHVLNVHGLSVLGRVRRIAVLFGPVRKVMINGFPGRTEPYGAFTKVYLNYAFFLSFHIWSPKWVLVTGMATHPSITFWSPKLDRPGSRGSGRHHAGRWRHPALNKPLLWLPVIPRPRVGLMAATTP